VVATLVELLRERARDASYRPYVFLEDGEHDERWIGAAELDERARAIACALGAVVGAGERALLVIPPGLDYIAAFFGCLYAGVIAVPAYPPDPRRLARTLPRLVAIAESCAATVVVTTRLIEAAGSGVLPALRWLAIDDVRDGAGWQPPAIDPSTIALIQYTSGSTAAPRGVVLDHGCVIANLAAISNAFELADRPPRTVSWLPPYHDMGLVGGILGNLYTRGLGILMSPLHFLQQPARWLRAITRFRADVSGGPNFAYDLCVRRVEPTGLDLSTWQIAFDGAEVVRAASLARFAEKFAPSGFRTTAFMPCYGLAEATLIATAVPRADAPAIAETRVSCGRPPRGVEVRVVDPETCVPAADGTIGEIWLAGPSIGRGYWGLPEESARVFAARLADGGGPYLRTGDLGCLRAGELYVTGRIKDVIIVYGRNLFPDDLERAVAAAHPAIRPGGVAAFADLDDRLVIAVELERDAEDLAAIRGAIRRALVEAADVVPHAIELLAPGALPKTASGKLQRHACRAHQAELARHPASAAASNAIVG
jgi:acyl-CoA synthetase (AMP-forming)/AMP-acid ligase II